ncbi:MAG: hypothetical protein NZ805_07240 [Armatimonadetes bacterium]|nr:hypothetical protein [Armatimonadota bacterium]
MIFAKFFSGRLSSAPYDTTTDAQALSLSALGEIARRQVVERGDESAFCFAFSDTWLYGAKFAITRGINSVTAKRARRHS